jgi:hypothetical protein
MSKSYKLKRAYTIFKLLGALSIAGMFIYKLLDISYTGGGTASDFVILVVCGVSLVHYSLSYMKVNMEKEDAMEKIISMVKANEERSKANRKMIERNNKLLRGTPDDK